jgi:hypothetical protein
VLCARWRHLPLELKSADEQRTLATTTVAALSTAAEQEANDRVRSALFDALEAWVPFVRAIVPAHAKLLAKLLKLSRTASQAARRTTRCCAPCWRR